MMKAIIVEDEIIAAENLQTLIAKVEPDIEIQAVLQSVEETVEWIETHREPDLIFMDIHLADGSAFRIFENVDVKSPVIFTTAYDEYALKAFEVNSIDYILKPICASELEKAIQKYKNLKNLPVQNRDVINKLMETLKISKKPYKNYFLIPEKDKLIPLAVDEICYIYIDTKIVKAVTFSTKTYYLEKTLDEISEQLDPEKFFRANRQYIISRTAVKDMSIWFGSKLSVNLVIPLSEKIIISKARVKEFKQWLTK
jgi:two-component system LytT family response regulator